jgi:CRISPR-associated protein Cas2
MLYLITYDVSTTTPAGRRRLRHAAQACKDFGQRVQFSVFECLVGPAEWVLLREKLLAIINSDEDSLRIYPLDENARGRIEHIGLKKPLDLEGPLIV